jgi:adenylate cyclase
VSAAPSGDSTYGELARRLLGGRPELTVEELARAADVDVSLVRRYWRAMGFPDVPEGVRAFTPADVEALTRVRELVSEGVGLRSAQSLVRAAGHSADRLALWQVEALVADVARRDGLDDVSARLVVLDRLADWAPVLEQQLVYTWRRQLAALLGRLDRDVSQAHGTGTAGGDRLPLERAVGFLDMIAYTRRAAALSADLLARLVEAFEATARDVIASRGARVVKTIGDAVLFVADDLETGARVSLELVAALAAAGIDVRGSLVWGRVLSRSGDVFGPSVNLASRLGDVAAAGTVVLDDVSAALLEASVVDAELDTLPPVDAPGLGQVHPVRLVGLGQTRAP